MKKQQQPLKTISRRAAQLPILGTFALAGLGMNGTAAWAQSRNILPKGLMLNFDLEKASEGLIPSKSLYPLFIPNKNLVVSRVANRNMLIVEEGQGITFPHSSLLEPDGDEWVISARVYLMTDGMIISQGNYKHGFAVFSREGQIFARVRTGHSAFTLAQKGNNAISKYKKRWVTIELRIAQDRALLSLNRQRVSMVLDEPTLSGKDLRIRLGDHRELPTVLKNFRGLEPSGFTGAISSFKIHRH